ncbi:hypothetical protein ACHWQZ_G009474 [Mnemiopsis leidyi]
MIVNQDWGTRDGSLEKLVIVFVILMIVSSMANSVLLVFGVIRMRKMKNARGFKSRCIRDLSFLYLVLCDLCQSLFGCVFRGPDLLHGTQDRRSCQIKCYFSLLTTDPFLMAILPITVDRFVATILPYKRKTSLHKKLLLIPIIFSWFFTLVDLAVIKLLYEPHLIGVSIISYNSTTRLCGIASWKTDTVREHVRTAVTMVLPLMFNLLTYIIIIYKICSRRVKMTHTIVSLKSFLICFFFTMSWIPSFIALDLVGSTEERIVRVSQLCLYLNCLLDPLLYSLPTKTLIDFLNKLDSKFNVVARDQGPSPCEGLNNYNAKKKKVSGPKTTDKTNV